MISLHSDITDTIGQWTERGWVCIDRDCPICIAIAGRVRKILGRRGFGLAALQDPRVAAHLGLAEGELLREMRVLTADRVYGGADAIVFLTRQFWWSWPLYAAAQLPGVRKLLRIAYRWLADHRPCASGACSLSSRDRNDIPILAKGERK